MRLYTVRLARNSRGFNVDVYADTTYEAKDKALELHPRTTAMWAKVK